MTLNGNITTTGNAATISLTATGMTLGSAVTTSGGAVTINLGAGAYATGGFILSTSNKNLILTAGSVTGTGNVAPTNGATVFDLGVSGRITVNGNALATMSRGATNYYNYDSSRPNNQGTVQLTSDPNASGAKWGFNATGTGATGTVWMNLLSMAEGKVVRNLGQTTVTTQGLDNEPVDGKILFRTPGNVDGIVRDYSLDSTGHEIAFDGVGALNARAAVASSIASSANQASAITFAGNNFFSGSLSLFSTGQITQAAGDKIDLASGNGNSLALSGTTISLAGTNNAIGTLGVITATGTITITNGGILTLSGNITSSGAIGLTAAGVSIGDSITVSGGDLSLTAGTGAITQADGKTLTIATGKKLIVNSSNAITLGNSGNSIGTLGSLTSTGAITLATRNSLTVTADITAGNSAESTINLTATGMNLTAAIRSTSGGKVTIELGRGAYNNLNGLAANTAGLTWSTGGKDVQLNLGRVDAGTGTIFDLRDNATPTPNTGKLRTNYAPNDLFKTKSIYINNSWSEADKNSIKAEDANADFHSLSDLNDGIEAGKFANEKTDGIGKFYDNEVVFNSSDRSYPEEDSTITFWNLRGGRVGITRPGDSRLTFAGKFVFAGSLNRFDSFSYPTTDAATMVVRGNSTLRGDITVVAGGITFEQGGKMTVGSLTAAAGKNLILGFDGDHIQDANDLKLVTADDRRLIINTKGNSLRLLNRANSFGSLSVTTGGGNFMIAKNGDLIFDGLATGGGSVVLDASGSIKATAISVGSVSFRAGSSVVLSGFFTAASGTGSSVSLNSTAAGLVLAGIRADSSVAVLGDGRAVLAGDIVGNSAVTIQSAVTVVRDSAVIANGGRIEFARAVAAINAIVGLRLDGGYGGVIGLGGNIGSPSLALGWVELNGYLNNPGKFGVYYSLSPATVSSGQLKNWRNGREM